MKAVSKHHREFDIFIDKADISQLETAAISGTMDIWWIGEKMPFAIKKGEPENRIVEYLDKTMKKIESVELLISNKTYYSLQRIKKSVGKSFYSEDSHQVRIYIIENVLAQKQKSYAKTFNQRSKLSA
jgi:hypothetical protein